MKKNTIYFVPVDDTMLVSGGKRFGNYVIDFIAQYCVTFGIGLIAGFLHTVLGYDSLYNWINEMSGLGQYAFGWGIAILYYTGFEYFLRRTPGKYITATKVVMADGSNPPLGKVLLRTICRFIPFEFFTFFGDRSRGLHDRLADTYVVDVNAYEHALRMKNELEEIGSNEY